jgi:hypothetical protein
MARILAWLLVLLIVCFGVLVGCSPYEDDDFWNTGVQPPRVYLDEDIRRCELLDACPNSSVVQAWTGPGTGINCVCGEEGD